MKNTIILKIAWRNLSLHRLRTVLTIAGFAVGAAAVLFLMGFGYGLERLVASQVSGDDAFLMLDIAPISQEIAPLNDDAVDKIAQQGAVSAVEPTAAVSARATLDSQEKDVALQAASGRFMDWRNIALETGESNIVGDEALVNKQLADQWAKDNNLSLVGKQIKADVVVSKELAGKDESVTAKGKQFIIKGIVRDDAAPKIYCALDAAKKMGAANYSSARVRVGDRASVSAVRSFIENMGYKTEYIGDTVTQINDVFRVFKSILGSFGAIALVVAIIGMFNTLTISLMERMRELALMKVLGIKPSALVKLVLAEALLVGLLGALSGVAFGFIAGGVSNEILAAYARKAGGITVSVFYFPFVLIAGVVAASILVSLLTGLLPARRATRVSPLKVFRYE